MIGVQNWVSCGGNKLMCETGSGARPEEIAAWFRKEFPDAMTVRVERRCINRRRWFHPLSWFCADFASWNFPSNEPH